jgi:hypothetical protein
MDHSQFGVHLNPGIAFFATDRIALEASFGDLSFTSSTSTSYDEAVKDESTTKTNLNFSLLPQTLQFGISFFFGGGGGAK